jgi:hypothetical protein
MFWETADGHASTRARQLDFLISNLKKRQGFRGNLIVGHLIKNQVRGLVRKFRGGCFAFDFFGFLERKSQQKCCVFDFPNFIKRVAASRFDFSLLEIKIKGTASITANASPKPTL